MPSIAIIYAMMALALPGATYASLTCKELHVSGFRTAFRQKGISAFVNQEKTAALAVSCQESKTSRQETLNEFGKTGKYIQLRENVYFNERRLAGGSIARNYIKIGGNIYQVSVITNLKNGDILSLQKNILLALRAE